MEHQPTTARRLLRTFVHGSVVMSTAPLLTLAFFLVLPLLQTLGERPDLEFVVRKVFSSELPDPSEIDDDEEEQEDEEEEPPPPELEDESPPADLSALELALNPGYGEGWGASGFSMKLDGMDAKRKAVDALFSLNDLDQKPRPTYKHSPQFGPQQQRKAPGRVVLLFIVNERGRVEQPRIHSSTDKVFNSPALAAIKKWKFEPGTRNGKPVRFRMRLPITFPKG